MRETSGCEVSTRPHGSPPPVRMLTTPGGKPASSNSLPNASIATGALSEAFSTTVLPAASAGAIFTAVRNSCEFHGTMAATTPSGSRSVKASMSGLSIGNVSPVILSAAPAKKWKNSAMYFACQRVSFRSLPVSTVSIRPSSSDLAASRSPRRLKHLPRSEANIRDHGPSRKARSAARTARSTSSAVASGTIAQGSAVVGLRLWVVPPSEAATQAPSISMS